MYTLDLAILTSFILYDIIDISVLCLTIVIIRAVYANLVTTCRSLICDLFCGSDVAAFSYAVPGVFRDSSQLEFCLFLQI